MKKTIGIILLLVTLIIAVKTASADGSPTNAPLTMGTNVTVARTNIVIPPATFLDGEAQLVVYQLFSMTNSAGQLLIPHSMQTIGNCSIGIRIFVDTNQTITKVTASVFPSGNQR